MIPTFRSWGYLYGYMGHFWLAFSKDTEHTRRLRYAADGIDHERLLKMELKDWHTASLRTNFLLFLPIIT